MSHARNLLSLLFCSVFCCHAAMSCPTEPQPTAAEGGDPCPTIRLVRRAEWGARTPVQVTPLPPGPVPRAFIHHTAMAPCLDFDSCCAQMRSIQNFHMDQRGWWDIGYSFLVGGDGRIYEGRGWDAEGAHTKGFNKISLPISFMGNYVQDPPSQLMLNATRQWIDCGVNTGKMSAEVRISGHRDAGCTECPGDALYAIIRNWPGFEAGPLPGYRCPGAPKNS